MKTLVIIICLLSANLSFAQKEKVKPTKCLFTSGAGKKGSTGSTQRSELCSEMNPKGKKRIAGVCVFDRVWKRGTWVPTNKGAARFVVSRVCDQGVEYSTSPELALPVGPQIWNPELVRIEKTVHTSILQPTDSRLTGKIPATCYEQNDPSTFASANARSCSSDILAVNFCELRNLTNFSASGKKLNGHWWVQYTDPVKRVFKVCVGGVNLVDATANDAVYAQIENRAPLEEGDARVCIRTVGTKKIELACAPSDKVNTCVRYEGPFARDAWKDEVYNYITNKYPDMAEDFSTKSRNRAGTTVLLPNYSKLKNWEPEELEDKNFLAAAKARLEATARWVQILKIAKDGSWVSTDTAACEEVIVARTRE
jgi:hypothetical protein